MEVDEGAFARTRKIKSRGDLGPRGGERGDRLEI